MTLPEIKRCFQCDEPKTLDEFHRSRSHLDGRQNVCKVCTKLNKSNPRKASRKPQGRRKGTPRPPGTPPPYEPPRPPEILALAMPTEAIQDLDFGPQWSAGAPLPMPPGIAARIELIGRLNDERVALERMERPDKEAARRLASKYAQNGMNRHAKEIMDTLA